MYEDWKGKGGVIDWKGGGVIDWKGWGWGWMGKGK